MLIVRHLLANRQINNFPNATQLITNLPPKVSLARLPSDISWNEKGYTCKRLVTMSTGASQRRRLIEPYINK